MNIILTSNIVTGGVITCNCGTTFSYNITDIYTKSECFSKGYFEDNYGDTDYVICPYCRRKIEVGYRIRSKPSSFTKIYDH